MEDSVQEAILHELPGLERFLSVIGILAGVAPLLGLLGTVTGMIATFNAITVFGSGEPRLMAGGISEALLTTAAGLIIAIPILFVHSIIASRVEGLIADMERFSATLINLINKESGTQEETSKTRRPRS
jgi:biopolymer transport protein ExbB